MQTPSYDTYIFRKDALEYLEEHGFCVEKADSPAVKINHNIDNEKEAIRKFAKSGGDGKKKRYTPLKEYALELARNKRPQVKGWRSRRQAVIAIQQEVLDKDRESKRLIPSNAYNMIYKWLAEMPDAEDLFPARKKKTPQ